MEKICRIKSFFSFSVLQLILSLNCQQERIVSRKTTGSLFHILNNESFINCSSSPENLLEMSPDFSSVASAFLLLLDSSCSLQINYLIFGHC